MSLPPKVFISYAHEPNNPTNEEQVLELSDRLRRDGVDSWIDQYEVVPARGWRLWMEQQIEQAQFVLMVATETYERRRRGLEELGRGLGARWEGAIISQALYEAALTNMKFIPVVFAQTDAAHIPIFLRDFPHYQVDEEDGYDDLYRRLTNRPEIEPPPIGSLRPLPQRGRVAPPPREPRISTAKLPVTGETFVAREDELARLDAAWENGTNVLSFVAMGGAGKSALVNRWLDRMQKDGWQGAERVLGWSFYSQGTDSGGASSEAFTEYALDWLGYKGEVITSPWKKGEVLAKLIREARTLLILDGLEPLQHPPGAQTGRIKDPAVQALVRELAVENPGLCLITTRLAVTDIAGRAETVAEDLEQLPAAAGAELLRRLGVNGADKDLQAASDELRGHGLALTLLGTYLRDLSSGDIQRRGEAAVFDSAIDGSEHAKHVMAAYERLLGPQERAILSLLGLFDRPAEAPAVRALRATPEIPGLTTGISTREEQKWRLALANLRKAHLVARNEDESTVLDTHPLVREYFGERLQEIAPEAWLGGHERLYDHYREVAPELPDTLEAMLPLYTAVAHGCRARRVQEAFEMYRRRIVRGNEAFSTNMLGAYGAELTAVAAFFDRPWDSTSSQLSPRDRSWILNQAGYCLDAVGRLLEAVEPMRVGFEIDKAEQDWGNAAIQARNLCGVTLLLGDVAKSLATAAEGVELADRSEDDFQQMANRARLGNALHQAGRWEESLLTFREAEAVQAKSQPQYPRLYSLQGYYYCDLLIERAEPEDGSASEGAGPQYRMACDEVRERAEKLIEWRLSSDPLLDIALDHLSLGRAHFGLLSADPDNPAHRLSAAENLDKALVGLRAAGVESELPRGLLARSQLRRVTGDFEGSTADLREFQEIVERGSMRLYEADAHLEWTRHLIRSGDPATARKHLARAHQLVRACGYGRREREVAWLENRIADTRSVQSSRLSSEK